MAVQPGRNRLLHQRNDHRRVHFHGRRCAISHVVTINVEINDLQALEQAAKSIGLTVRQQSTYRWWGEWVGDYSLPAGFEVKELGHCTFALAVAGSKTIAEFGNSTHSAEPYEIGVVPSKTNPKAWTLLFDFYGSGGKALQDVVGHRGQKLMQAYSLEVVKKQAMLGGYTTSQQQQADGSMKLVLVRG